MFDQEPLEIRILNWVKARNKRLSRPALSPEVAIAFRLPVTRVWRILDAFRKHGTVRLEPFEDRGESKKGWQVA